MNSARTRLVWFVAIAGFSILNGKPLWDQLGRVQFDGALLAALAAPWALSALFAVVTHFIIDEVKVRDDIYFATKLSLVERHLEKKRAKQADYVNMISIIYDTHPRLVRPKQQTELWLNWSKWLERVTLALLILGFVWSVIGPFILANLVKGTGSA